MVVDLGSGLDLVLLVYPQAELDWNAPGGEDVVRVREI